MTWLGCVTIPEDADRTADDGVPAIAVPTE